MWTNIISRILDGERNVQSPFDKNGVMEHLFVVVDEESKMGYFLIWCSRTHKGINISRMRLNPGLRYISAADFKKFDLPKISFVYPKF